MTAVLDNFSSRGTQGVARLPAECGEEFEGRSFIGYTQRYFARAETDEQVGIAGGHEQTRPRSQHIK